ncbi:glycosyltransferase family 2 protein, partial [Cylindrospermopsis raciborskii CS-506_A]
MKITKVAAIIVTWNKRKDVCTVIEDIENLDLQNISLDIFVVDNASQDGTQNYLELHYPHIKVLQTGKNLGGSGGFSQGMNFVSNLDYQYIWLLDNDVRLDPYALVPLV